MASLRIAGNPLVYTPSARAAHVGGVVVLRAGIDENGHVASLAVVSGPPVLKQAALDAVRTWIYKPFLLNGKPVQVDTVIALTESSSADRSGQKSADPGVEQPVRVSSGVMSGRKIFGPFPLLPQDVSTSGGVVLHALISENGTVQHLDVLHGSPALAEATIGAVKLWRYQPYLMSGRPVVVETTISIYW